MVRERVWQDAWLLFTNIVEAAERKHGPGPAHGWNLTIEADGTIYVYREIAFAAGLLETFDEAFFAERGLTRSRWTAVIRPHPGFDWVPFDGEKHREVRYVSVGWRYAEPIVVGARSVGVRTAKPMALQKVPSGLHDLQKLDEPSWDRKPVETPLNPFRNDDDEPPPKSNEERPVFRRKIMD